VVRYRLDGSLRETAPLSKHLQSDIAAYVKQLAGLDPAIKRPQDGHFEFMSGQSSCNVHASIAQVLDGERIVMTIVQEAYQAQSLRALGYWGKGESELLHALSEQHGLVFIASAHNAERAAVLHSCIKLLTHPSTSIISIEDQIEYRLEGTQQLQLDREDGLDLASAIRLVLRQDPNILVLSDVHDQTGLDASAQAATKHLVCAGVAASDAATAYARLTRLSHDTLGIATSITAIAARKSVRQLCASCREPTVLNTGTRSAFRQTLDKHGYALNDILQLAHAYTTEMSLPLLKIAPKSDSLIVWCEKQGGCKQCHQSGFNGQSGLTEVLPNNPELQNLATESYRPQVLKEAAKKNGMVPIQIDALVKCLSGIVDYREVADLL
jgi:type II secretory ATPase GspE/PulE/Tfp pilus assembly ATPase PilB-like protein